SPFRPRKLCRSTFVPLQDTVRVATQKGDTPPTVGDDGRRRIHGATRAAAGAAQTWHPLPVSSLIRNLFHRSRNGRFVTIHSGYVARNVGAGTTHSALPLLWRQHRTDVHITQLLLGDLGGCTHHQVLRVLIQREGDRLANVRLVREQHDDPVDAGGDAPVRRGTELQGLEHAPEFSFHGLLVVSGDPERLVHDFGRVITNGPRGELHTVADDVVLPGEDLQGILGLQRFHPALGHGERVVAELDRPLVRQFEHRKIHDPAEPVGFLREVPGTLAGLDPYRCHDAFVLLLVLTRAEEQTV